MIDRRGLLRALDTPAIADWVVIERDQLVGCVDEASGLRRAERRHGWQLTVHHDAPVGRGSAHVTVDAAAGDAIETVRQAEALARSSIGAAWVTRPPAAPARVKLADPAVGGREPLDVGAELVSRLARPAGTTVSATVNVLREQVAVVTRQGLRVDWDATHLRAELLVALGERSLLVTREARRIADLGLDAAIASAAEDLGLLASAEAPRSGPCTLVLRSDAMLHDGLGIWAAFVPQADAVVERQGLTRYREGRPIAPGAEQVAEPLGITSNGAFDFGLKSAPVGDEGEAVRRFTLVERGVASGLGLTPREASLRGRDPNGGVRNLVVERGGWDGTLATAATGAGAARIVEVRRLRSLSIDPYTGDASLEIALGLEHGGTGSPRVFTGGSLRIDMIAALATARRSNRRVQRGAYVGPEAVLLPSVELIA